MSQQKHVFGDLLPANFLLAHHFLSGGVHQAVANDCATLAATHLNGLTGKTTIHPGAGFGSDMWAAYMHQVHRAIGLEISPAQIEMGKHIISDPIATRISIFQDPLLEILYKGVCTSDPGHCRNLTYGIYSFCGVDWIRHGFEYDELDFPPDIRLCDITNSQDIKIVLGSTVADAVIANFFLHTIVGKQRSTQEAFEILAPLVCPGGVLIISLPSQAVEFKGWDRDRKIQTSTVFHHPAYLAYSHLLQEELRRAYGEETLSPIDRSVRFIKEQDLIEGSSSFKHISSHTRPFLVPNEDELNTMAGLLMFEAVFTTRRTADDLVPFVRSTLDQRPLSPQGDIGIHVNYHVLRRV